MRHLTLPLILITGLLSACQNGDAEAPLPDACYQPPESGMCKAAFQRYYYDAMSDSCRTFIWGGCKGSVPFETMEECVSTCDAGTSDTAAPYAGKGAPR